jgi:DNA-binding MarR family transcriptional regulator
MNGDTQEPQRRLLGALLRVPYLAIVQQVAEGLATAGYDDLRPAHLVVFQHIRRDGSRVTELAEQAAMTKQSMGYLVNYLEEHEYVERVPDSLDGRAKLVRLTAHGLEVMAISSEIVLNIEARWASRIGEEQVQQLIHLLQEVALMLGEPIMF